MMKGIPDFRDLEYSDLINTIKKKKVCIFIGAGVSKLAGYKLWKELANELVEIFWNKQNLIPPFKRFDFSTKCALEKENNPINVMDYLYTRNESLFNESIEGIFRGTNEEKLIYDKFKFLSTNKNVIFIQTNIDRGLERCLGIDKPEISINPDFGIPRKINYIHGRIDKSDSWIFIRKQYNNSYFKEGSRLMKFLIEIFMNYNVIFFGYSLSDHEILQAIAKAKLKCTNEHKDCIKYFCFESTYKNIETAIEIRKAIFKENYSINIIPYSIDNKGYGALFDVMDALNKVLQDREIKITQHRQAGEEDSNVN